MARPSSISGFARRFVRAREGAVALEFAFIAAPFFLLLLSILEIALVFFAGAVIESAVAETSREIRTGTLQSAGGSEASFKNALCARIDHVADCSRLRIDVRSYDSFASTSFASPIDEQGRLDESGFAFNPGGAEEIVVVRVFYPWQVYTPSLGLGLANMEGNQHLITAATAFRNEPFAP